MNLFSYFARTALPTWLLGCLMLVSPPAHAQLVATSLSNDADSVGQGPYRVLAPGVVTTIPSPVQPADSVSRHDMVEILAANPTFGEREWSKAVSPAKNVRFTHDVWGLDFSFKPMRMIEVQLPDKSGELQPTLVWYLVYYVTNRSDEPVRFVPRFWLEGHDYVNTYEERLLPHVVAMIQNREDPNRKLRSSAEMMGEIPPSTPEADRSVWGVVTWTGIDPRTDDFSIYVQGLTNAYRWEDDVAAVAPGAPPGTGRKFESKTLELNFWRPGDEHHQHEDEFRFGAPDKVDYQWIYR